MKPTIDYVHSLGLTFGLYTSVGDKTCHGGWSPGSYNHWQTDADTFGESHLTLRLDLLLFPLAACRLLLRLLLGAAGAAVASGRH